MSEESAFIPGIHNYCDRWCERCPFVSRCRVGAAEQELADNPEAADMRNAAFWERMQRVLHDTMLLIAKMAHEHGIDLDQLVADAAALPDREPSVSEAHAELVHQAELCWRRTDAWFEANKQVLKDKSLDLMSAARMGLPGVDPADDAVQIKDSLDVILWYSPQILVKLKRASGREPGAEDDPLLAEVARNDADGSAKVALIGMDRSLAAWGVLHDQLPDAQDAILDILVHLDRLRRAAEQLFPNARAFVRPGLDQPA